MKRENTQPASLLHKRVVGGQVLYSHVVAVEGRRMIFVAGQLARDPDGNIVGKGEMRAQIRQVGENLKTALAAALYYRAAARGWKSSIGLPEGSSRRICEPPGPVTTSLPKRTPAARSRFTSTGRSSTIRWMGSSRRGLVYGRRASPDQPNSSGRSGATASRQVRHRRMRAASSR
jgi:hypothetical protein